MKRMVVMLAAALLLSFTGQPAQAGSKSIATAVSTTPPAGQWTGYWTWDPVNRVWHWTWVWVPNTPGFQPS